MPCYDCFIALAQPEFLDVTVNEGELLKITCLIKNIPDIATFEVLDPNGTSIATVLGVYSVPNVTRYYAGIYTCVVNSILDNSTVNETSVVTVQCKLKTMMYVASYHGIYPKQHC